MHNEKCDSYKHDAFENCMPDSLPHRHTMFLLLDHFDVSKKHVTRLYHLSLKDKPMKRDPARSQHLLSLATALVHELSVCAAARLTEQASPVHKYI
jgi:hypothetical protein